MYNIEKVKFEISINGEMNILDFQSKNLSNDIFVSKQGIKIKTELSDSKKCYNAIRTDDIDLFRKETDTVVQLFIDKYNDCLEIYDKNLESGIETTNEEIDVDPEIVVPYDPNSIRVTQGRFSLKEIFEMINGNEFDEPILDLSPDFERNYVWDITRKARLIESILLKIPLPVFYLARDFQGKYQVVDGVQRLSVINEFFSNKLKLKNLEYLKDECNNKYFQKEKGNSLHPKFVRYLRTYQIDCNIIEPETPHKVKLDIFKRLNTGGRSLNSQEIRNSILKKESREFIKKLAGSEYFKIATNKSVKPKRMMDQELITRYIGFYLIYKQPELFPKLKYNSKMDGFLDDVVEILNNSYLKVPFNNIEKDFYLSMDNAYIMFREYAFRKIDINFEKHSRNMINKSLFTTLAVKLSNYDTKKIRKRGNILNEFADKLKKDEYLFESITYGTNDRMRIDTAFMRINEFLETIYGGNNVK